MSWQDKIRNPYCELCELNESADHVCLMGSGPRKARIMVVGEAPGAREDESHKAFVGQSGQLLRKTLKNAGIDPAECYITNVVKCRPPDNETPSRKQVRTCVDEYFIQEFDACEPSFVLLLGNSPLQGVLGKSGITKHRGTVASLGQATVLATYHPAFILRSPGRRGEFEADIGRLAAMARGDTKEVQTRLKIVRTTKQLAWLIDKLRVAEEISYDIETTGLLEWAPDAEIVTISFTWQDGLSVVVPLAHEQSPFARGWKQVLKHLKPVLEREDAKYIAHNGKFDCRWLAAFGVFVPQTFDTMLAAHMIDEDRLKGLKPLSQVLLGASAYDEDLDKANLKTEPLKQVAFYNGRDTDYTLRLYHVFREQLREEPRSARVFMKLMMPASNALTRIERIGLWVDRERLDRITIHTRKQREAALQNLLEHVPAAKRASINFNSPPQVGQWLFGDLGLKPVELTKTGNPSTAESSMLRLANEHPAPQMLLEYRKWTKYLNTYLEPWAEYADKQSRIHTNYKLYGTVTGRISSEKPNLQQVPRDGIMRTVFGAPPGWQFVEADYSQVELRIAAMVANDPVLKRIFATGRDPHLETAVEMTRKRPEDVEKEERKKAKAVNFGFLYGMGFKRFVEYARDNYGVIVSEPEAKEVRDAFFRKYPRLKGWHDRQRRLAERYERVVSPIGRVRHLPNVRSGDREVAAEALRQAINSPVQSFASDLMLLSLVRLTRLLPQSRARIVGTVHDALLFEVRDDVVPEMVENIRSVMEDTKTVKKLFGAEITVPIEVEISVGSHWGEGKVV